MNNKKLIVPNMIISGEMTVSDEERLADYERKGADALLLFDYSEGDNEHEDALLFLRRIAKNIEIPIICGGHTPRFEDVKKLLYAGAAYALVDMRPDSALTVLKEGALRFGKERLAAYTETVDVFYKHAEEIKANASLIVSKEPIDTDYPVLVISKTEDIEELTGLCHDETIYGISGKTVNTYGNLLELKNVLKIKDADAADALTNILETKIPFSEFKLNKDGLIPVVVQDYNTDQVLMLAYMNAESYAETLRTGKMTYFSRSRSELWTKGETSGHFQYVKSLYLDCDHDTILAKVNQVGPACHTGSMSCFFNELVKQVESVDDTVGHDDMADLAQTEASDAKNSFISDSAANLSSPAVSGKTPTAMAVLEKEYATIMDRKTHPKEGSYTNYLFDKGIDKILKKVGEEATEIVIAAKNPEPEEIIYEIADFLYHVSVLMAEKGITWEQITQELQNRK